MRIFKLTLLVILVLVVGFFAYAFLIYPAVWYRRTKLECINVLAHAKTTNELSQAVGSLGVFLPLTNGGWIAIRYLDSHSGGIRSCAVARDNGGGWFESARHFCGRLSSFPQRKSDLEVERWLREHHPPFTNQVSVADRDRELYTIESAPDLASARLALAKIGFTEFKR